MRTGYTFKWLPVMLIAAFSFSSCNKWLDVSPKSEIEEDELLSTAQGFKDALFGAYSLMTDQSTYGGEMTMGMMSALGQDYDLSNTISFYYGIAHYNYKEITAQTYIETAWVRSYNTIANLNNLLGQIDAKRDLFSGDEFGLVKGEALGLRALLHFDLLRMFAPSYLANKNATAIPYVTIFSKKATPRSTVAEVTELALKDLEDASALMQNDPVKNAAGGGQSGADMYFRRACHFNRFAVAALKARILLYQGQKEKALEAALKVINNGGQFRFVQQNEISASPLLRDRTFSTEHIFALYIQKLLTYTDYHFRGTSAYVGFSNTADNFKSIFEVNTGGGSTDYRYNYLVESDNGFLYSSRFWQLENADTKLKYLVPLLRLSEMYYIAAECTPVVKDGIGYLNQVRTNRGIAPLPDNLTSAELMQEILKEYRKEFYSEGQTFFQYKRLDLAAIPGSNTPGSAQVYVLPIPANETEFGK